MVSFITGLRDIYLTQIHKYISIQFCLEDLLFYLSHVGYVIDPNCMGNQITQNYIISTLNYNDAFVLH